MHLARARAALLLLPVLLAACAGKIETIGAGDGGTGRAPDGGSSSGSSGSGSGSSGSGSGSSGSGSSSSGPTCVDIDPANYDTSCQTADDCISITSGDLCTGDCACGGSSINGSGEAQYKAALSSIQLAFCSCPSEPNPACINHHCTTCPDGVPDCDSASDAGSTGSCVNIDLSTYDTTCKTSSDCVTVTPGTICTGSCECGGGTINVDGLSRYNAAVSGIAVGECPCVEDGFPTCVQNHCVLCGFADPACPDGG